MRDCNQVQAIHRYSTLGTRHWRNGLGSRNCSRSKESDHDQVALLPSPQRRTRSHCLIVRTKETAWRRIRRLLLELSPCGQRLPLILLVLPAPWNIVRLLPPPLSSTPERKTQWWRAAEPKGRSSVRVTVNGAVALAAMWRLPSRVKHSSRRPLRFYFHVSKKQTVTPEAKRLGFLCRRACVSVHSSPSCNCDGVDLTPGGPLTHAHIS